MAGPEHGGILHELAHHGVFGSGVAAAGCAFDAAGGGVAAVVVAGNDAVENGEAAVRAFVRGVVVHHVHHHAQTHAVQRLDHGAKFADSRRPLRIGGVAAFRHVVEHRIVAPVEGVQVGDGGDDLAGGVCRWVEILQLLQNRRGVADVAWAEFLVGIVQPTQLEDGVLQIHLLRRVFVDGADIESR